MRLRHPGRPRLSSPRSRGPDIAETGLTLLRGPLSEALRSPPILLGAPRCWPRQPAEAATPANYFFCRDPGAGFAPSCLGECAIAALHEPEHRTMWYRKNVGGWERAARLIGGGLM